MLCRHAYQRNEYLCCGVRRWKTVSFILAESSGTAPQKDALVEARTPLTTPLLKRRIQETAIEMSTRFQTVALAPRLTLPQCISVLWIPKDPEFTADFLSYLFPKSNISTHPNVDRDLHQTPHSLRKPPQRPWLVATSATVSHSSILHPLITISSKIRPDSQTLTPTPPRGPRSQSEKNVRREKEEHGNPPRNPFHRAHAPSRQPRRLI